MRTSLEGWAQAFHFSDDLEKLETLYQQQHHADLAQAQTEPPPEGVISTAPEGEEHPVEERLDTLAVEIASRIGGFLTEPDVVSHYLKLQELQRDNHLMASYIEELLDRVQALEMENRQLRRETLTRLA